jgi:hypothetical protein
MDPLSITASVIAVITAAMSVAKNLEQLRTSLCDASSDLCSVMNDISDLRIVLDACETAFRDFLNPLNPGPAILPTSNTLRILSRAETQLKEMDRIVCRCVVASSDNGSASRVALLRWLLDKGKVQMVQMRIRDTKQDLVTLLGAHNL